MGKTIIEKTIIISLILLGFFLSGSGVSAALELAWPRSPLGTELNENSLTILIKYIYEWGISLAGFAVFIVLVWAGFEYLTSAGNPGKMSEALDWIKSAVFGLVLLLSSVLILNAINPQLTNLRIPEMPAGGRGRVATTSIPFSWTTSNSCVRADLFSATNYNSPASPPSINCCQDVSSLGRNAVRIQSVSFAGRNVGTAAACQLNLYGLSDYGATADRPPVIITRDTPDLRVFGVNTDFRSAKLINLAP